MLTEVAQSDTIKPATQQQVPGFQGVLAQTTHHSQTQHSLLLGIRNCTVQLVLRSLIWKAVKLIRFDQGSSVFNEHVAGNQDPHVKPC